MRQPNACCFGGIQGESHMAWACSRSRVGVGRAGWGISWNRGLVLVGAVCGEGDSKWYTSGPVRGKHYAAARRAKRVNNREFSGLAAGTTAIPRPAPTGKGARAKRLGKQARERLRRQEAKKRDQSSIGRPDRAQASGPRDQVEQTMNRQEQAPAIITAADDDLAAPSSCSRTSSGDGGKDQEEFCARLNRDQRIVITNPEFGGAHLEGGETRRSGEQARGAVRQSDRRGIRGAEGRKRKKNEQLLRTLRRR